MEAGREINWLDASTRTGWVQDYQVAVSGAGEKMNYNLSAAYSDNQGVVIGDDYNRITALAKINTDITSCCRSVWMLHLLSLIIRVWELTLVRLRKHLLTV